jgi:hypothetical protein
MTESNPADNPQDPKSVQVGAALGISVGMVALVLATFVGIPLAVIWAAKKLAPGDDRSNNPGPTTASDLAGRLKF